MPLRRTRTARLSVRARPSEPAEPVDWKARLQPASGKDEPVPLTATEPDVAGAPLPWNETLYSSLLEPGAYVFHVEAPGYQPWQREVQLTSGRLERIDVVLERAK